MNLESVDSIDKTRIRDYVATDYESIVLLIGAFKNYELQFDKDSFACGLKSDVDMRSYTDQILKDVNENDGFFYIVEEDGKLVGFATGIVERFTGMNTLTRLTYNEHDIGWLGIIYLTEDYRGKGISRRLIERARKYLKGKGCAMMKLHVLEHNSAVKVYEKLDFRTNGKEMVTELL